MAPSAGHRGQPRPGIESFFFLADLHSLDRHRTRSAPSATLRSRPGLRPGPGTRVVLPAERHPRDHRADVVPHRHRQQGHLNRAHAYKAAVDKNREEGVDEDAGVSAGLFMYPVLMAADILIFKANQVPVGRDQIQHIEMARDFAQRFNHVYGKEYFPLPDVVIDEQVATLAGLDGRKMSKSYHNTIPLFVPREELKKLVFSILTDSRAPGEPKDTEGSALFQMYQAFATPEQTAEFAKAFAAGISWGDAKQQLFERIDSELSRCASATTR